MKRSQVFPIYLLLVSLFCVIQTLFTVEGSVTFTFIRPALASQIEPAPLLEAPTTPQTHKNKGFGPSQEQKDLTSKVCSKHPEIPQKTCVSDLLALSYTESRFDDQAVGDHGASFGPFQIYTKIHKEITKEQAMNYEWAANWTLDRMIANGYPKFRTWAIGAHNSYTPEVNAVYSKMVKERAEQF